MNKTKIEWCNYTINPVKGLCPMGCSYCYARRMYKRFKWNPEIRFEPESLLDLAILPNGSKVFIGSMIELFHESTMQWMDYIIDCIARSPWQTSILLTKRPQNLIKWSPFPDNCWVGVSVSNDKMLDIAVDKLEDIQAKTKFISLEPLLKRLTLSLDYAFYYSDISWLIIGAQTPYSAKTSPSKEWVDDIIDAADKAGIPVFLKENLRPVLKVVYGDNIQLRQEFPRVDRG